MANVVTNVPIDSNGNCPNPDQIVSTVSGGDVIQYKLVAASPRDNIGDWQFMLFVRRKSDNGRLPLTLSLPVGQQQDALVLPTMPSGTTSVNLKVVNVATHAVSVIDPQIIYIPR